MRGPLGLALLVAVACGGRAPMPRELETLRQLEQEPAVREAIKVAPDHVQEAQSLERQSESSWKEGRQYESRRDALLGIVRLKTALALVEQERARSRVRVAEKELNELTAEQARLEFELANEQEKLNLLGRVATAEQAVGSEKQRGTAQQRVSAAALAVKNAEAVDARLYAAADLGEAQAFLSRAQQALGAGDTGQASTLAGDAHRKADQAAATARPMFEKAQSTQGSKARAEALMKDAAGIPRVTLRLERQGEITRVILPLTDLFSGRRITVRPTGESVLDAVAELVKKYPTYPVQVIGHTDSRGRQATLLVLSQARAQAVYDGLVGRGVEPARAVVSGRGAETPISDNRTRDGRAQNNRVEVIFIVQ